ncbi:MAG TPA: hypothetical protein VKF62_04630, partial [Planctomycetota bacterium]|nr:hypothetical protein [Planctomycetota bacterium]
VGSSRAREWFLLDADADPRGFGERPGALFAVDLESGAVRTAASSPEWRDPTDLLFLEDGTALLLDYRDAPEPDGRNVGAIFRVDPDRGTSERVAIPDGLVDPVSFAREEDGSLLIADKNASPGGRGRGALFRLSPGYDRLAILAAGPPLAAPADVRRGADGHWYLLDADAGRRDPLPEEGRVRGPPPGEGTLFRVESSGLVPVCAPAATLSPLSIVPEPGGTFLLIDANADPKEPARLRGAVFRVDPRSGGATLVCASGEFRDPLRGEWDGEDLLVVDANADPGGFGDDGVGRGFGGFGRGAVFRLDPRTGRARAALVSREFRTPTALRSRPALRP